MRLRTRICAHLDEIISVPVDDHKRTVNQVDDSPPYWNVRLDDFRNHDSLGIFACFPRPVVVLVVIASSCITLHVRYKIQITTLEHF